MIPGAQKFFHRQPSEYEKALQIQVNRLEVTVNDLRIELLSKLDEVRRQALGYIKPEPEVVEEPMPAGFQTFTQRRAAATQAASQAGIRKVAKKTEEVLKREQSNG